MEKRTKRMMVNFTDDEYARVEALALSRKKKPSTVVRELAMEGMEPQIFNERAAQVQELLVKTVEEALEPFTKVLLTKTYNTQLVVAQVLFSLRDVLAETTELSYDDIDEILRENTGRAVKHTRINPKDVRVVDAGNLANVDTVATDRPMW